MGPRHVGMVGGPHDAHSHPGEPLASRRQVGQLEDGHIATIPTPPAQVATGGGIGLAGSHHLDERVTDGEYGVGETEHRHPGIVERVAPAKGALELISHLVAVTGNQRHLAQAGSGEHALTLEPQPGPRRAAAATRQQNPILFPRAGCWRGRPVPGGRGGSGRRAAAEVDGGGVALPGRVGPAHLDLVAGVEAEPGWS